MKYQVAISFAGEERTIAREIAAGLQRLGISVFFDEFEKHNLWGHDLYQLLQQIYRDGAIHVLAIFSENYLRKKWTLHELRQAQERAFSSKEDYILPLRVDDTQIPGLNETTGYIDYRTHSAKEICLLVAKKLGVKEIPRKTGPWIGQKNKEWVMNNAASLTEFISYEQLAVSLMEIRDGKTETIIRVGNELLRQAPQLYGQDHAYCIGALDPEQLIRVDYRTPGIDPTLSKLLSRYKLERYVTNSLLSFSTIEEMMDPQRDSDFAETWTTEVMIRNYCQNKVRANEVMRWTFLQRAFELFEIAHEFGDPEGSWLLAWRYKLGEGIDQNEETANFMFRTAAERGHESARQLLASTETR